MARYVAKHFDDKGKYRGANERALEKLRESKTAPAPTDNSRPSERRKLLPALANLEEITKANERTVDDPRPSETKSLPQRLTVQQAEAMRARHEQWVKERESPAQPDRQLRSILILAILVLLAVLLWW
jgi:hypothetical protein